jgi:hypothetical protein|tara:strand:- start:628 stop:1098 length:471 start_codon:yes stop_codon:yes gene_type:complete
MTTLDKSSRKSDSRIETTRKKSWTLPSSLDAPPAPHGYVHRWIRTEVAGFQDAGNVSKKLREGYEFVRSDEYKDSVETNKYPIIATGQYQGFIGIGGLVLARIPEEILKQRNEYFSKITQDQMTAVQNDLMKEQHPGMPINIDRQTRVTFGGGRKR